MTAQADLTLAEQVATVVVERNQYRDTIIELRSILGITDNEVWTQDVLKQLIADRNLLAEKIESELIPQLTELRKEKLDAEPEVIDLDGSRTTDVDD